MTKKLYLSFFIFLLFFLVAGQSFAEIDIQNKEQWAINRLAELEGYTDRWTTYVEAQLAADPVSGLAAIDSAAASSDGATFTDISILNGIITITLNSTFNMGAIDAKTITLTPVTADMNVDGNDETIMGWTCVTTVVDLYKWGQLIEPITYLAWPLSLCS